MNKISDLKVGYKIVTKGLHEAKIKNILFKPCYGWSIFCVFKSGAKYELNESSINWQKTNELNNKQMKELKIEVPEGYQIDKEKSTFEKIVFKAIENKLPMSVEEIPNRKWYISLSGDIRQTSAMEDKYNLSTKERAEAFLSLMQLVELRDAWNGDSERHGSAIVFSTDYNGIRKVCTSNNGYTLSFKSPELRDQFAEQFKDLIQTAKELL